MKKVKSMKVGMMVLVASLTLGTVSCNKKGCTDPTAINYNDSAKKDDGSCIFEDVTTSNIVKSGAITSNETWTAGNIYELAGKVIVEDGVTLTIEPGTIIKGREGSGTLASALVIAQGGKLDAIGTVSAPIIFTSILDNIQLGEFTGTNLDENDNGKWGGLLILGRAPISAADGDNLSQIEGIPVTDDFGAFGGSDAADNSGTLTYISIRHGGALIGAGNEINGLTLGGVGSGTSISNIEIVSNLDDGIEFFGGTVNVSNIVVGFQGDDGIDIDMNYSGTVDNFVVINSIYSDEGLEIDGPEGTTYTNGMFTLMNGTVYNYDGSGGASGDFKSKAQGTLLNVNFGAAKIRASYQNDCADPKTDSYTHLTDAIPTLVFTSSEYSSVTVYTGSKDDAGVNDCTVFPVDQAAAEAIMNTSVSSGASLSGFGWTWLSVNGRM